MTLTHILVDFENVQPSAGDIALVRGEALRLAIFRGPGQMKYSADVAEAWQPLGASVSFIHCAKAGRNAVDMHIAFYLGERVAAHGNGAAERPRFVIVSKDTDFDPLLLHIRAQGFDATRVSSIKAALGGRGAEPKAEKARAARAAPAVKAAKSAPAKAPATKKAVTRKTPAKPAKAAPVEKKNAPAEKRQAQAAKNLTPATKTPAPAEKNLAPATKDAAPLADALDKVIDSLRRMGDRRPAKRAGLERHIESHLGRDLAPGLMDSLMQQLERDGVLAFDDNKVQYRLAKARK